MKQKVQKFLDIVLWVLSAFFAFLILCFFGVVGYMIMHPMIASLDPSATGFTGVFFSFLSKICWLPFVYFPCYFFWKEERERNALEKLVSDHKEKNKVSKTEKMNVNQ